MSGEIVELNDEDGVPPGDVVVDFWAPWCGPCRALAPLFAEEAAKRPGVVFAKVNVDECPDLMGSFGVRSVPTVVRLRDGAEVARTVGLPGRGEFSSWLDGE